MLAEPLLTIGIPTYNRAGHLQQTLNSIYSQIGTSQEVEVLVISNHSTDQTDEVISQFSQQFHNLTYKKNEVNLGVNKNVFNVLESARGKYCLIHGDDDLFLGGTLAFILNGIKQYPDRRVYFIDNVSNYQAIEQGNGMNEFLKKASYFSTHISSVMVNRQMYHLLQERDKFLSTNINQVYIMLSLIGKDKPFIVFKGHIYWCVGLTSVAYKYGEVFIKNYQEILNYFIPLGLSKEVVEQEKLKILQSFIIPYYRDRQHTPMSIEMYDTVDYYAQYYKDEPYFETYFNLLKEIQRGYSWRKV